MDKKIVGYADRISVAPGERIRFMVSCEPEVSSYRADIVRLLSGDTQPDGPGYRDEAMPGAVSGAYPGRHQATHAGSFGLVPPHPVFEGLASLSLQVTVYPTLPDARRACVLSKMEAEGGRGFALWCDPRQGMVLALGDGAGGVRELSVGRPVVAREWYLVRATYDADSGEARVSQRLLESYGRDTSSAPRRPASRARCRSPATPRCSSPPTPGRAAGGGAPCRSSSSTGASSARSSPPVPSTSRSSSRFATVLCPRPLRPSICAAFDFSREIHSDAIVDISRTASTASSSTCRSGRCAARAGPARR